MTYGELVRARSQQIARSCSLSSAESSQEARIALESVFGITSEEYILLMNEQVNTQLEKFESIIRERCQGVSLAAILGKKDFFGLTFSVTRDVLIPRPETELVVSSVLDWVGSCVKKERTPTDPTENKRTLSILDMCCGSGCIGLALARTLCDRFPSLTVSLALVDISEKALSVARQNADKYFPSAKIVQSDLFSRVEDFSKEEKKFDIVVSNPPYISEREYQSLAPEVKSEPKLALVSGGELGQEMLCRLIGEGINYLAPGGVFATEIGYSQAQVAIDSAKKAGFIKVKVLKDLAGLDRVIFCSSLSR